MRKRRSCTYAIYWLFRGRITHPESLNFETVWLCVTFRRIPLEDSYLLTCDQDELVLLKIACFQHNWLVGSLTVIIRTPTEFDVDIHTTNICSDEQGCY